MTSHLEIQVIFSFYLDFRSLLSDCKLHYTEFYTNSNTVQRLGSPEFPELGCTVESF